MKKVILTLVVFCGFAISVFAQKTNSDKFSIGIEGALPVGNYLGSSYGIGNSIKYDHLVATDLFITGTVGYTYYHYKSSVKEMLEKFGIDRSGEGNIPVKVGAKYFLNSNFYGEVQAGIVIATVKSEGTSFAFSPGVGYNLGRGVDLGFRYEGWSQDGNLANQLALRLAYSF